MTIAATTRTGLAGLTLQENVTRLLELGIQQLVLPPDLSQRQWNELEGYLPRDTLAAAYAFIPRRNADGDGVQPAPRLGSLDPDERREVLKRGRQTIELMDQHDIPALILPPVTLELPTKKDIFAILDKRDTREAWDSLLEKRAATASTARQRDSYLASLDGLLQHADRYKRRVMILPGGFPCELPDWDEVDECLREFSGAPLELLVDMVRCERAARAHDDRDRRVPEFLMPHLGGVLVHDGTPGHARLALGSGQVTLESWLSLGPELHANILWIIDLSEHVGASKVLDSIAWIDRTREGCEKKRSEINGTRNSFLDNSLGDLL